MTTVDDALALVHREALSFGRDVRVVDRAGSRRYMRGQRVFLLVRPLKRRLDVAFRRLGRARSKRILDARTAGLPFLPYRVVVEAAGDVDSELRLWMRESYESFEDIG